MKLKSINPVLIYTKGKLGVDLNEKIPTQVEFYQGWRLLTLDQTLHFIG